jgi:hypothetical membrane protein
VTRVAAFTDRHPLVGPTVYVTSVSYFVAQLAVAWVWRPPYSLVHNTISDLGNTACGEYGHAYLCSPRHAWMNAALITLGVIMALGSLLIYQEFREASTPERRGALLGFSLMALAGVGTILVGCFPENVNHAVHIVGATLAIGVGDLAIVLLGWVLTLPDRMRTYMRCWATLALGAAVCFACHRDFGIGAGTMERIAAYPETIWLISFGLYTWRMHYRRRYVVQRVLSGHSEAEHPGLRAS